VLLEGADRLEQVAQREYGDPALWRAVADANGIDDPTRVARGRALLLPPTSEARTIAGGRHG
jgi:nucleoid-associated protein YgaU